MQTIGVTSKNNGSLIERGYATLHREAINRPLLFILAAGFALRALAAVLTSGAIDGEGAEYARIAQNLLQGNGYTGIAEEGTQLFFPPLFPFAIAAISLVTRDAEIAGRMISVIMGTLTVVPTYLIALRMYDRRTAIVAAIFVSCFPYLIFLSTTVNCEISYLTLILTALYLAISAVESPTRLRLTSSGVFYALAYLVRPDAIAYMLTSVTLIFLNMIVRRRAGAMFSLGRIGMMIGSFCLVATPYVAWLSIQTGQFRIEGKSPLNITTERRIQLGEIPAAAAFGVNKLGQERGVWNQPNLVIIKNYSFGFTEIISYIRAKTNSVFTNAREALVNSFVFGGPILFALVILGLLARPWPPLLAIYQFQIFGFLALMIFGTYFIYYNQARFYVLLVPLYCIWGAAGLYKVVSWWIATESAIGLSHRYRVVLRSFVWAIGVGSLLGGTVGSAGFSAARAERAEKIAGEWLRTTFKQPIHLLDSSTVISFHANALHFWLPYCDEETALKYIQNKNINAVVIRESDGDSRPYLKSWVDNGIPISTAALVYSFELGARDKIKIYRIGQ